MKALILIVVLLWSAIDSIYGQCNSKNTVKIDSVFSHHFSIVDSAYRVNISLNNRVEQANFNDSLDLIMPDYSESIRFLEIISKIPSSNKNYFNTPILDKKIIDDWKNWYKNNSIKLCWDRKNNRVNRKDIDIYSGELKPKF